MIKYHSLDVKKDEWKSLGNATKVFMDFRIINFSALKTNKFFIGDHISYILDTSYYVCVNQVILINEAWYMLTLFLKSYIKHLYLITSTESLCYHSRFHIAKWVRIDIFCAKWFWLLQWSVYIQCLGSRLWQILHSK